jgi:DivIVA domain-containing protein
MADFTPDDISRKRFSTSFRGFDPIEVQQYLETLASAVSGLVAERDKMAAKLSELGERDLKSEFESIGREVSAVLEAARDAADQLRQRATNDATRWRSEAVAEAEQELRRARADAEQLRGDAWAAADALLKQVTAEAERIESNTEKERLRMVGEAERESHRVVAAGRREAEDMVRNAKMEADRLTLRAQSAHDELIDRATRQADAAQERTRALEIRRQELKLELDSIRHALATAEGELEERRTALQLSPQTVDAPVTPPEPETDDTDHATFEPDWTPGETVRVVRPGATSTPSRAPVGGPISETPEIVVLTPDQVRARREAEEASDHQPEDDLAEVPVEPVSVVDAPEPEASTTPEQERADEPADTVPEAEEQLGMPVVEPPEEVDVGPEPTPEPDQPEEPAQLEESARAEEPADDDTGRFEELSGLFARLREPSQPVEPEPSTQAQPVAEAKPSPRRSPRYGGDPFELRSRLILPVSNRALRNIKRQLTEAQNEALEELRLSDGEWEPDGPSLGARLRPDLVVLASEAFASGHAAAMEMTGERFKRPSTPKTEPENEWIAALLQDVNHALVEGRRQGQGARQLGASVSRVFRAWRTDEAERRVADLAASRYHAGIAEVLESNGYQIEWVVAGRGCTTCRTSVESEPAEWETLPPAHPNCGCTLVPA